MNLGGFLMQIYHMFTKGDQPIETKCPHCSHISSQDIMQTTATCANCGKEFGINEAAELMRDAPKQDE